MVRITGRNLNHLQIALAHRAVILKDILRGEEAPVKEKTDAQPFGEDVNMINHRTFKPTLLTTAEKDEVVVKYESGMTMTAIANIYGCHYTTVGSILRKRGVEIRT